MRLNELYDCPYDVEIKGIKMNSKEVVPGDLFICTKGVTADRHDYVEDAIHHGAVAIVASRKIDVSVPVIYVEDTNRELPHLCSKFYRNPQDQLALVGITGTNGKTTVAMLIQDLLGSDICGYVGTNGIKCHAFQESIRNTTPDVDRMIPYLRRFADSGCKIVSMETSSEAFFRKRLDLFRFQVSVLTNITQDHLNIHKTLENYIDCKCELFRKTKKDGFCILNRDDEHFEAVRSCCNGKVLTYGTSEQADLRILKMKSLVDGTDITFQFQEETYDVHSPLIGEFNVYNLMAAFLVGYCFQLSMRDLIARIDRISMIPGRMELLKFGQPYQIILDYAHTPDALQKILSYLAKVKKGRLITVTGSAGGREQEKRGLMGKLVLDFSDHVIFTMDDPRNEDVNTIIDDLISLSDKKNYERIIDREEAIFHALDLAKEKDIVLIAGKGRDNYMAYRDLYLPYCDYDEVKKYFDTKKALF